MTTTMMGSQPSPEQRREVEGLVCGLPGRRDQLAFEEPWEVRALALAVAAHKTGQYPWSDFQEALIASIKTWEESVDDVNDPSWSYYEHWVNAFEAVLDGGGSLDPAAVASRTQQVLDAPPNRNHHDPHYDPVAIDPAVRPSRGENS
ncbi:nitrile hydratase accessory protein [Streptomyces sp. B21-101]|uniref:nitrile hydratase accessory protein n=1 Tax=Streptomyces sp. B21-101 TaxID=3039415 RepID=UPI002FF2E141